MAEKIRLTVLVDADLHGKVKVKCARKRVTITEMVTLMLQQFLKEQ